jgi:hypothetical protein
MPPQDRLRLNHAGQTEQAWPEPSQPYQQRPVTATQMYTVWCTPQGDTELIDFKSVRRLEQVGDKRSNQGQDHTHRVGSRADSAEPRESRTDVIFGNDRSLYQLQTLKVPKPNAGCGDLKPPVWLGGAQAPFSPLWLPRPCSQKTRATILLAPTCRHNRSPTATAFGESLAASRRTSSPLGQILDSCFLNGDARFQFQTRGATKGSLRFCPEYAEGRQG